MNALIRKFLKKWDLDGLLLEVYSDDHSIIKLSKLIVPKDRREQGLGTEIMKDFITLGDLLGLKQVLIPCAEFGATSMRRLVNFYKRFGFKWSQGKSFHLRHSMYRMPQRCE